MGCGIFGQEDAFNNSYQKRQYLKPILLINSNQLSESFLTLHKYFKLNHQKSVKRCIEFLQRQLIIQKMIIICLGRHAQDFLKQVEDKKVIQKIYAVYIYCQKVQQNYSHLMDNIIVKGITNTMNQLINSIDNELQIQLHCFRRLSDRQQKSIQLKYSYILTALLIEVKNKQQRQIKIKLFLKQNKKYGKPPKTERGNKPNTKKGDEIVNYTADSSSKQILNLYAQNSVYNYVNSVLKTIFMKKLEDAAIFIGDLYRSINQFCSFEKRKKLKNTILYRGGTLSNQDIRNVQIAIHSDIEMLGFFSTSKSLIKAQKFMNLHKKGKTLFIIYIPQFFKKQIQKHFKIRGGYVDLQYFQPQYQSQQQVLFNIKTIMRVLRFQKEDVINKLELIYGIDQMMRYIKQYKVQFNIHSLTQINIVCKQCQQKYHFIGSVSKKVICLKNFNYEHLRQQPQSIFLINSNKIIDGMIIEYSKSVQQKLLQNKGKCLRKLCTACQVIVKCSDCSKPLCLCNIVKGHNLQHLQKSVILIESDIPRFISLQNQTQNQKFYETYIKFEEKIKCLGDAMLITKDIFNLKEATIWYDNMIRNQKFLKMGHMEQFQMYFNRAESRRLKKYTPEVVPQNSPKVTKQQYQLCKKDYEVCMQIIKRNNLQKVYICLILYSIGIISNKQISMQYYQQALDILEEIRKQRPLNNYEKNTEVQIINCIAFYYMIIKQFEMAALKFKDAVEKIVAIDDYTFSEEAKYLNNCALCLNRLGRYEQSLIFAKKSLQLRIMIFGSDNTLTKISLSNYEHAKKMIDKKCQ